MPRNRFYKEVSVEAVDGGLLHGVLLDGKVVKTPAGAVLALPSVGLAHAIAEEWRAQDKLIRPETMVLTKLGNTAIDRVVPNLSAAREQILAIAKSDVVCYRADFPSDLVHRQELIWDPLITWMRERFSVSLRSTSGVSFVEQEPSAVRALDLALSDRDAFFLSALYAAAALCGSIVIALALAERKFSADDAVAAANLDRFYQAERWGWDEQASAKIASERAELNQISRYLELLRT